MKTLILLPIIYFLSINFSFAQKTVTDADVAASMEIMKTLNDGASMQMLNAAVTDIDTRASQFVAEHDFVAQAEIDWPKFAQQCTENFEIKTSEMPKKFKTQAEIYFLFRLANLKQSTVMQIKNTKVEETIQDSGKTFEDLLRINSKVKM
jgi:hypothetical protein